MDWNIASFLRRLCRDESGAVMVLVAISIVALLLLTALAVDLGTLVYAQRRLQATTEMAALTGALEIYSGSTRAVATATQYSAVAGNNNAQSGLTVSMVSGYPALKCLTTTANLGMSCTPSTALNPNANAIEVQQQATVPLSFGSFLGISPVTLTATSLASAKGGGLPPMNIMLVIDNTASMNDQDPGGVTCGGIANATRIQCALAGVQTLLNELWPTQDQVGIMVFPGLSTSTMSNGQTSVANDNSCSSTVKKSSDIEVVPYSNSPAPVYQLVAPTAGYCSTSTGSCSSATQSLSLSSSVVTASCQTGMTVGSTSCGTCAGQYVQGGEGTYYAGALNAAQAALVATNKTGVCANLNCQNVIILLSDGGAGNASNLWSANTAQATLPGGTTLTMASSVPADVIPGSSVAESANTNCTGTGYFAIPCGTLVVSTSGATVTLSNAVVAAWTPLPQTNADTPVGSTTLYFGTTVPTTVTAGLLVTDQTNPSAIPAGTTVTAVNSPSTGDVTISNPVTGTAVATDTTSAASAVGSTTLTFASVPATVTAGMGVTDTTDTSAIPATTTVLSTTATTVTISNAVGLTVTDSTSGTINSGSTTLTLTAAPTGVTSGFTVSGTDIAAGTTVTAVNGTTVTISKGTTGKISHSETITFTGDSVAKGDTITFSGDVAKGDTIVFGGVGSGVQIAFGSNNQCHEAITAAQNAAKAGTWVYSIAYGSSTVLSPPSGSGNNSCSDYEFPSISSCTTMQDIASDPSKFYSDPMGGSCTSPYNPNYTSISQIFQNIGLNLLYTQLLPPNTN